MACERAERSNLMLFLMLLGRSVISDVDHSHPWTLRVVEKVRIRALANPESGECD